MSDNINDNISASYEEKDGKKGIRIILDGFGGRYETSADLPTESNTIGDIVSVQFPLGLYQWSGTEWIIFNGKQIESVSLHTTVGNIKTYRMLFTDGTYFDYDVIDGTLDINGKTDKPTPSDIDNFLIEDNANGFFKVSWTNIKATLKTYFDTIYTVASNIVVTTRNILNSTNLDTALANLDKALTDLHMNGFSSWTSGSDASTYTLVGTTFTLLRSGIGKINSKEITWIANQAVDLSGMTAGTTEWIYINSSGIATLGASAGTVYQNIPLFFVWFDGTNYFVEKENHNYDFQSKVSSEFHNSINVFVRGAGCVISKVGAGTGVSANDRRLKITGDTISDHGLTAIVSPTDPMTIVTVNTNAGGKWLQYHTQDTLTAYYNNGGTPTACDAVNYCCIYSIYVLQDDINSSTPRFMAVMDTVAYSSLALAQAAITAGTVPLATNEIKTIEPCQLGYVIVSYSATGGQIEYVLSARNTFNQAFVGGGAGATSDHALQSNLEYSVSGHTGFEPTLTATTLGNKINSYTPKTTPVDADMFGLMNSELSNIMDKISWANIKAALFASPTLTGTVILPTVQLGEFSVKLDAALSADGKWSGITEDGTSGETLVFGELVYFKAADSRWWKTDANVDDTAGSVKIGMVVLAAASGGNATEILLYGKINAASLFPTLTIGAPAYIGETAGTIVVTQPTTANVVIRKIGFANTADELFFSPSNDFVTHI